MQPGAASGVHESQRSGVQGLATQGFNSLTHLGGKAPGQLGQVAAIKRIPQKWMPALREMHTDLMRAPRKETTLEQAYGSLGIGCERPVAGCGCLAAAAQHRHLLAVARAAADAAGDLTRGRAWRTPYQGQVAPFDRALGELPRQRVQRGLGFGRHHDPAGVLVEAMHDAGPTLAAYASEFRAAVRDEGIDQRTVRIARGGMDNKSGGLVDHDQVGILVENLQVQRLCRRRCFFNFRKFYGETLAGFDPSRGLVYRRAVDAGRAFLDQVFYAAARQPRQAGGQEAVEPEPCILFRNDEFVAAGRRRACGCIVG